MRKIINSASPKYQDVLTDNLVLDTVPTVNSFNCVTSDAVARAVAGASGEVPQVTEGDNGKILTAIYDEGGPAVEWGDIPATAEVPTVGENDNGKILTATYSEGEGGYAWAAAPAPELPPYSETDAGKVLQVQNDGTLAWVTLE